MREVEGTPSRVSRTRSALRRMWNMLGARAVILLYHRVTTSEFDPYKLRVTPERFAEQLQVIRDIGRPMRLADLARGVGDRKLPDRAVCVTFDDGYADNLHAAKDLLERYGIPATVFVTTGTGGRGREFWWDELESMFLQRTRLPDRLQLDAGDRRFDWDLGESACFGQDDLERHKAWTMPDPDGPAPASHPTERHAVFCAVYRLVRSMDIVERERVLDRLRTWAGVEPSVRATHRALALEEVAQLERGGLVDVGAHTVNHPVLSAVASEVQQKEISQSKAELEQCLEHPLKGFSYPYGLHSEETVAAVRDAGFEHACACSFRAVRRSSDVFLLPRVATCNANGDDFARSLREHFLS